MERELALYRMYSKKKQTPPKKKRSDSNETKHKTYLAHIEEANKKRKRKRKNVICNNILSKKDV